MGAYNAVKGIALLPASLLTGILWDRFGALAAFGACAVLSAVAGALWMVLLAGGGGGASMKPGASAKAMVREQLLRRGVRSRHVIGALLRVDRRIFVPAGSAGLALGDHPVSIACGQTVSQPYMVALMLDALQVRRGMSVLEVGAGSGYVLALLSAMGARPCGVEWHEELARRIPDHLRAARCGDGGRPLRGRRPGLAREGALRPHSRERRVSARAPAAPRAARSGGHPRGAGGFALEAALRFCAG